MSFANHDDDGRDRRLLNLHEFCEQAPLTLDAFKEATLREWKKGDDSMNPKDKRDEIYWWKEVACYLAMVDKDEDHKQEEDRRRGDRRRHGRRKEDQ